MSIEIINGDLLNSNVDYICHQVNCQGKMNSGIAKSIREKWPEVYKGYTDKWLAVYQDEHIGLSTLLGTIQIIDIWDDFEDKNCKQAVINMFAQYNYGYDGRRYTSYDAFWLCLNNIAQYIPKGSHIGFPYNIGCGRGGANWNIIYAMINEVLAKDFVVKIYKLEDIYA